MIIFGGVNEGMFDWPWSGIHFASGLVIGMILGSRPTTRSGWRFWLWGIGLLLLWEVVERTMVYLDVHAHQAVAPLKAAVLGFAFSPEPWSNTVGDMIIGPLGLVIGRWLSTQLEPKTARRP